MPRNALGRMISNQPAFVVQAFDCIGLFGSMVWAMSHRGRRLVGALPFWDCFCRTGFCPHRGTLSARRAGAVAFYYPTSHGSAKKIRGVPSPMTGFKKIGAKFSIEGILL